METKIVTLNLRIATANDFKTNSGEKKAGALYFQKNSKGDIEPYPLVLNEDTELQNFKNLFNNNQIFVPYNYFDIN